MIYFVRVGNHHGFVEMSQELAWALKRSLMTSPYSGHVLPMEDDPGACRGVLG